MIHDSADLMKDDILSRIGDSSGANMDATRQHIRESMANLFDPFNKLETPYFQRKYLKDKLNCLNTSGNSIGTKCRSGYNWYKAENNYCASQNVYYSHFKEY